VGKKVELYLLEQVSKGLTVSLAFKCLAGLQPFSTPATVLKQPVKSSICLFRYEGEKYQVILGMQNLGNRRHYSIYVVPRSKKRPQILLKRHKNKAVNQLAMKSELSKEKVDKRYHFSLEKKSLSSQKYYKSGSKITNSGSNKIGGIYAIFCRNFLFVEF
jgi:hypothetical protein